MTTENPRSKLGLFLVALFLGAAPAMLWLGRWKLALVCACAGVALIVALLLANGFGPPWPAPWNAAIEFEMLITVIGLSYSAIAIALAFNINEQPIRRPWYSNWFVALVLPLAIALSLPFAVRTFFYQPFNAPSESSFPNLLAGDYFFISKSAYRNGDPQRGDIAVFKLPSDPRIDYVKRVVGLPGDRIQMTGGILHINGQPVKLEPVELPDEMTPHPNVKFLRETLPDGRSYVIADTGETEADSTQEYQVPEGHYFALGDNRDNSQDSRYLDAVGYIPRENFVGPFAFRFWTSNAVPMRLRPQETYPTR